MKSLTEDQLVLETKRLVQTERNTTFQILEFLSEIDRRKTHLRRGFGSLHDFAVQELGYSSAGAHRRIQSMRAMIEIPEIIPAIQSGELNLTQVAMVQTTFRKEILKAAPAARDQLRLDKKEVLQQVVRQSTRQTEKLLKTKFPDSEALHEGRRKVTETQTEVRVVLNDFDLELLQTLKHKLAHSLRQQTDSETISKALELALKLLEQRCAPKRSSKYSIEKIAPGRFIPKPWSQQLLNHAQNRCEYFDPKTGQRCGSRFALEIDHRIALFRGGKTELQNLHVLCASHNQWKK